LNFLNSGNFPRKDIFFNFPIFVSGCQLAASSLNVRAEVLSHGVVDFILSKDGLEFLDDGVGGFLEGG